jgi:hypothetical protein
MKSDHWGARHAVAVKYVKYVFYVYTDLHAWS